MSVCNASLRCVVLGAHCSLHTRVSFRCRSSVTGEPVCDVIPPPALHTGQFPLLTTKRVFWRGVVEELLWFVRGCTDARELQKRKIHFWDGNSSREFLDKCGFTDRQEGESSSSSFIRIGHPH